MDHSVPGASRALDVSLIAFGAGRPPVDGIGGPESGRELRTAYPERA
jgi:hypothetical protein